MSVIGIFRQLERRGGTIHTMIPVPWPVVAIFIAAYAAAGLAIGAVTGWLISRYRTEVQRKILTDAVLGLLGFVAGLVGCLLVPWPENTVVEQLSGGGTVETTMTRYQHPERVAIAFAVLLPLLYELFRRRNHHAGSLMRDR